MMLQVKVKGLYRVELWNAKGLPMTVKLYPSVDLEISCELLPLNLPDIVRESAKTRSQNCIILEVVRSTPGGP